MTPIGTDTVHDMSLDLPSEEVPPPRQFEIILQDEHLVAIRKPAGILVHRSALSSDTEVVLQLLSRQLNAYLYPVHRLDRATSGVLLFALTSAAAGNLCTQFRERTVTKLYHAVVRGWTEEVGRMERPLLSADRERERPAVTAFRRLDTCTVPHPVGPYPSARYSLVEIHPLTGRRHQIRRHFKHAAHPIVGDTTHGDGDHNRLFRERFGCHRLLLEAVVLTVTHPEDGQLLRLDIRDTGTIPTVWHSLQ